MKSLIANVCILGMIGIVIGTGVFANTEAEVAATVMVQNIAVSVSDGSIDYGTLGQNSTQNTLPGGANDMQTATNDGNVTSDIKIKGTNSNDWTLGATAGDNIYTHHFCNATDNDCTTPLTNYTALTTSYTDLKTDVAASGTVDFHLQINTPNPSSVFTQQNVNVWVQASASS